jgi:hypothetical protein
MQDSRIQPVTLPSSAGKSGVMPGLWPAAGATILSAALCATWLMSDSIFAPARDNTGRVVASELAPLDELEIDGALTTMEIAPAQLARVKERTGTCLLPLAWVTVAAASGQSAETIRLRSGSYFSPVFKLSDMPVRIAIPYPAPYEIGHGTLTVLHEGGDATIALRPAWHLAAGQATTAHEVTWHPDKHCDRPNG